MKRLLRIYGGFGAIFMLHFLAVALKMSVISRFEDDGFARSSPRFTEWGELL